MVVAFFVQQFRYKLMGTMALDYVGSWVIEQICSYLFSDNKPKASLFPVR